MQEEGLRFWRYLRRGRFSSQVALGLLPLVCPFRWVKGSGDRSEPDACIAIQTNAIFLTLNNIGYLVSLWTSMQIAAANARGGGARCPMRWRDYLILAKGRQEANCHHSI